jgi:hypothetical protein
VQLYVKSGCGFRGVVTTLSILNEHLGWGLVDIPNRNSIENWVKKSGLSIYREPESEITRSGYAMIVDESMMIGSQKMLLTLGIKAEHRGKPLSHGDVEVLGMNVRSSWNGDAIRSVLEDISRRLNLPPLYVISDNASIMNNGIGKFNVLHVKDISHTLGMFMERVYGKDEEFNAYMKELSGVKFREVMKPVAYLLPPKQRCIARFLNLSGVVDWSVKILTNHDRLTASQREIFSFIPRYASLIDELQEVLSCVHFIEREVKQNGLSVKSFNNCMERVKRGLSRGNARMVKMAGQVVDHLNNEVKKLPSPRTRWNASSDIIESIFGVYKHRKARNPLHGVTPFVLLLPLHARIGTKNRMIPFDFKHSLESVFMSDINDWRKNNLPENLVCKRTKTLKIA